MVNVQWIPRGPAGPTTRNPNVVKFANVINQLVSQFDAFIRDQGQLVAVIGTQI